MLYQNGEKNDGKTEVESAGYVSRARRIESLIYAGKRLEEIRHGQFDYQEGMDPDRHQLRLPRWRNEKDLTALSDTIKAGEAKIEELKNAKKREVKKDTTLVKETPPEQSGEE